MRALFETHRPEIVFHAAAHKHVPLMEANPSEAVKNNVLGTADLAAMCDEYRRRAVRHDLHRQSGQPDQHHGRVEATGRAIRPRPHARRRRPSLSSSDLATCWRRPEAWCRSSREQIKHGGPITVTHPDMTRFFMTIPEASQLVLQASAMGKGGEIFVLDMGEQVKIVDLAKDLIRLSGFAPDEIPIEYVGVRPGEKLYEELYMENEEMLPTPHPKLRMAYHHPFSLEELHNSLDELRVLVAENDESCGEKLCELAIDYTPTVERDVEHQFTDIRRIGFQHFATVGRRRAFVSETLPRTKII